MTPITNDQDEALSLAPIQQAKPKRRSTKRQRSKFISALTIKDFNGEKYRVPATADSAAAHRQLLASKVSAVFEQNLDMVLRTGIPLDGKTMADLAKAANTISDMMAAAHKGEAEPAPTTGMSQVGQLASQMMAGAMQGITAGATMSLEDRMARISQLGKRQEKALEKVGERVTKQAEKAKATEVTIEPEQTND